MKDGPNIVGIAALIGDHARCAMLTSLMSGVALTATELATEAGITKQTASSHLNKLTDAGLLAVEVQGRHRYYRLAAPDVAHVLEGLMGVAQRTGATRVRPGPREPALRKARVCYDHLAGELGVALYDSLLKQTLIKKSNIKDDAAQPLILTPKGKLFFAEAGIDTKAFTSSRRPVCKSCLDWSVRRHHLAGALGAAILQHCYHNKWAKRISGTRVVRFTPRGEQMLRDTFALEA